MADQEKDAAVVIRVRSGSAQRVGDMLKTFADITPGPEKDGADSVLICTGLRIPAPEFGYIATRNGASKAHII